MRAVGFCLERIGGFGLCVLGGIQRDPRRDAAWLPVGPGPVPLPRSHNCVSSTSPPLLAPRRQSEANEEKRSSVDDDDAWLLFSRARARPGSSQSYRFRLARLNCSPVDKKATSPEISRFYFGAWTRVGVHAGTDGRAGSVHVWVGRRCSIQNLACAAFYPAILVIVSPWFSLQ